MSSFSIAAFPRLLRFWLLCSFVTAAPSYYMAASVYRFFRWPGAMVTMAIAIALFAQGLALVSACFPQMCDRTSPLAKAVKVGFIVRLVMLLPFVWQLDMMSGAMAVSVLGNVFHTPMERSLVTIFLTCICEGLILLALFSFFSFLALIVIQFRARRAARLQMGATAPVSSDHAR